MATEFKMLPKQLAPPPGSPTGISVVDKFLFWNGLPKGDISLLQGPPGTGATSLWISAMQIAQGKGSWAAWINGPSYLLPSHLQKRQVNLQKLLVVEKPVNNENLFSILKELISSSLFEVIGCELERFNLKKYQIQILKDLCQKHQVALAIISHVVEQYVDPLISLILNFQFDFITIKRALDRPTPFSFSAELLRAVAMPSLASTSRRFIR